MAEYDQIGANYEQANVQFYKLLESTLVKRVLMPEIRGRRGLNLIDFAAGSGYYTSRLFSWTDQDDAANDSQSKVNAAHAHHQHHDNRVNGETNHQHPTPPSSSASSSSKTTVTAVDISQVMLDINARINADKIAAGRLRLITADCTQPQSFAPDATTTTTTSSSSPAAAAEPPKSPGYFDGAIAGWLLNYAFSRNSLHCMLDNVARSLLPGGFFVTTLPFPCEDLDARRQRTRQPPLDTVFPYVEYIEPLPDGSGFRARTHATDSLSFFSSHQRWSVVEEVAREVGFGPIERWPANLPRDDFIAPNVVVENDLTDEQYDAYRKGGMFVVVKMYKK